MASLDITLSCTGGLDKYPAKSHARRVAQALGRQHGFIHIVGSKSAYYDDSDMPIPFRQDRYFYYLTGCNEPNCQLIYDLKKDWLILYLPPITWTRFYYDGRGSTIEEAEEAYDIDQAIYIDSKAQSSVPCQGLKGEEQIVYLLNTERRDVAYSISLADFDALRPALDACRAVKDEHEIALIRKANEITASAHRAIIDQLHNCHSEADVEAIYMAECVRRLAKVQSYEPIVAAGESASFLHYIQDQKPFGDSQLLLVDAGCEWQCYASDVTRTLPINKKRPGHWPSTEAQQIYEAVERVQEQCISHMRPANKFSTVNKLAQELVVKELLQLGILRGDPEDIMSAGTHRAFFPHGLGHHMGLEVHDVMPPWTSSSEICQSMHKQSASMMPHGLPTSISPVSSTTLEEPPMEKGNVITVEPGIYFNRFVLERFFLPDDKHSRFIDKDVLKRFVSVGGARIEDDILITDSGFENLTTTPKAADALEIWRAMQ